MQVTEVGHTLWKCLIGEREIRTLGALAKSFGLHRYGKKITEGNLVVKNQTVHLTNCSLGELCFCKWLPINLFSCFSYLLMYSLIQQLFMEHLQSIRLKMKTNVDKITLF